MVEKNSQNGNTTKRSVSCQTEQCQLSESSNEQTMCDRQTNTGLFCSACSHTISPTSDGATAIQAPGQTIQPETTSDNVTINAQKPTECQGSPQKVIFKEPLPSPKKKELNPKTPQEVKKTEDSKSCLENPKQAVLSDEKSSQDASAISTAQASPSIKTNEEPSNANKEPSNANKEPSNANKEPSNANKEPSNANKEPSNANIGAPTKKKKNRKKKNKAKSADEEKTLQGAQIQPKITPAVSARAAKVDGNRKGNQKPNASNVQIARRRICIHVKSVFLGGKKNKKNANDEGDMDTVLQEFAKEFPPECLLCDELDRQEEAERLEWESQNPGRVWEERDDYKKQGGRPRETQEPQPMTESEQTTTWEEQDPDQFQTTSAESVGPRGKVRDAEFVSLMDLWPAYIGLNKLQNREKSKYIFKVKEALCYVRFFRPIDYTTDEGRLGPPDFITMVGENKMGMTDFADLFLMHDLLPYYKVPPPEPYYESVFEKLTIKGTVLPAFKDAFGSKALTPNINILVSPWQTQAQGAQQNLSPEEGATRRYAIRRATKRKGPMLCMACNGEGCQKVKAICYSELYDDIYLSETESCISDSSDSTVYDLDETLDYENMEVDPALGSETEDDLYAPPSYETAVEQELPAGDREGQASKRTHRLPRPSLRKDMSRCINCRRRKYVTLKTCVRCEMAKYCTRECQNEDYHRHKEDCIRIYKWRNACERLEPHMVDYLFNYNLPIVTEFRQVPDCYQALEGFNRCLLCEVSDICDYYPSEDYAVFIQDETGVEVPLVFSVDQASYYMPNARSPTPLSRLLYPGRFVIIVQPVWVLFHDFRDGFRLTDLKNLFILKATSEL